MTIFTIGELIELAIGSPEPGHVNFMALQCLLHSFAEKMRIMNDKVDLAKYANYAKLVRHPNDKSTHVTIAAASKTTTTTTKTETTRSAKSNNQMTPRRRASIISVTKLKQCIATTTTTASSGQDSTADLTSVHSHFSDEGKSPKRRRALVSMIERRFNSLQMKDRLAGGADEPPADENTVTEGEKSATEETQAAAASAEEQVAEQIGDAPAPPSTEAEVQPTEPTEAAATTEPPAAETTQEAVTTEPAMEDAMQAEEATAVVPAEFSEPGVATDTSDRDQPLRLSRLHLPMSSLPEDLRVGIAIMKDQLDLAMEELSILTQLMINNKIDVQRIGQLRQIASRLRAIQRDNVYIEGTHRAKFEEKSISWVEGEGEVAEEDIMEEAFAEEEDLEVCKEEKSSSRSGTASEGEPERYDLGLHVCYSPDKMLELVLDLKSEFCALTNKVNEIAAQLLKHDSHRMMTQQQELQEQMRDFKIFMSTAKDIFDRFESDRANNIKNFDEIRKDIEDLKERKIDRAEVEVLLSEKVDYQQLARKVNNEQLQQLQCRMERQFCEINKLICLTERGLKSMIEELRTVLGQNAIEDMLKKFKQSIDADICCVANKLQKYIDATNDDCAAAGARYKVLQDVACVSCDTECVMRTAERNKVPKLKSAHATDTIAPLVTYELSSIRKSGIMGYIRKDEFPESPNAWLKRQGAQAAMKMCVPRRAGGPNTTYTAKERMEKVFQQKKV